MLTLPIKRKWFNMILSGEKKEEYREIKQYYRVRFERCGLLKSTGFPVWENKRWIRLRNGYSRTSPSLQVLCSMRISKGNSAWGAEEDKVYYVLKIWEVKKEDKKQC